MAKRKSTKEEFEDTKGAIRIRMSMSRNVRRITKGAIRIRMSIVQERKKSYQRGNQNPYVYCPGT